MAYSSDIIVVVTEGGLDGGQHSWQHVGQLLSGDILKDLLDAGAHALPVGRLFAANALLHQAQTTFDAAILYPKEGTASLSSDPQDVQLLARKELQDVGQGSWEDRPLVWTGRRTATFFHIIRKYNSCTILILRHALLALRNLKTATRA